MMPPIAQTGHGSHHQNYPPSSPNDIRSWLSSHHPKTLSLLDAFETQLRLGRLSTSSSSTRGSLSSSNASTIDHNRILITRQTVELLRAVIGGTKWIDAAGLMRLLTGVGSELNAAGGYNREPAVGNVVKRIMCAVRDEVAAAESAEGENGNDGDDDDTGEGDEGIRYDSFNDEMTTKTKATDMRSSVSKLSISSMLWAHPQHLSFMGVGSGVSSSATTSGQLRHHTGRGRRSDSISSMDSDHRGGGTGGGGVGSSSLTTTTKNDEDCGSGRRKAHMEEEGRQTYPPGFYVNRPHFRQSVMEALHEIMSDLEDIPRNINDQALAHIHSGEVILAYGRSNTVELFLKAAAAKGRKIRVIVCEGAPHFSGHAMARSLADSGIGTTVIHDSAAFAVMARVNKVLLPAHAVLANGGLIAPSGTNMVALAASRNSVPCICVTGLFKLCPTYPHEGQDTLQDLSSPSSVVDYSSRRVSSSSTDDCSFWQHGVELINPVHDYISPELINLYVTNIGAFQPSYIYRLLAEYYHIDDWEAFE